MDTEIEKEISINKVYYFPSSVVITKVDEKFLVIHPESSSWLVFNLEELKVFDDLRNGHTIGNILEKYDKLIAISVLTQIEAKHFETPFVKEEVKRNIYIYLTNFCNLRCKHCYMYAGEKLVSELSLSDWKKIILDFKKNGGNGITFTGGEVTIYKEFAELIKYTHNLGISVTVLTNGLLWTPELIQKLSLFIDEVQISIDGYDSKSYASVRQVDGFQRALDTIIAFSKTQSKVCMAVTPLYDNIEEFVKRFESFGKRFLKENPNVTIKINMELIPGREINPTETENQKYREKLKELTEVLYPDYYKKNFILNFTEKTLMRNCGFGEISLASNGDVYWCNRIFELSPILNIKDSSFKDLFKKSDFVRTLTDVDHSELCSKCEIRYICGGSCRIKWPDINNYNKQNHMWQNVCPAGRKEKFYKQMIESNEFFFQN